MDADTSTHSLAGILSSAAEFGLTSDEVWQCLMATPDRMPTDVRARYIDELSGELAKRLVAKQRVVQATTLRPVEYRPLPPRSPLFDTGVTDVEEQPMQRQNKLRRRLLIAAAVTLVLILLVPLLI